MSEWLAAHLNWFSIYLQFAIQEIDNPIVGDSRTRVQGRFLLRIVVQTRITDLHDQQCAFGMFRVISWLANNHRKIRFGFG
jgi:hypothetical protein